MTSVDEVVNSLEMLLEDDDIPQSVEEKIIFIVRELKDTDELSLTVNKAQNELEDLSEDVNIPPFVRTQVWNILSELAALESEIVEA